MNKELICIVCPKGCRVTVYEENGQMKTTGNACLKGNVYAIQESTAPKRMLTSTVKIHGALHSRCPVVSSAPLPKESIRSVIELLEKVEVTAPVTMNSVILENVNQSGVDIVISRNMEKAS